MIVGAAVKTELEELLRIHKRLTFKPVLLDSIHFSVLLLIPIWDISLLN
jgi:hypothetical protein